MNFSFRFVLYKFPLCIIYIFGRPVTHRSLNVDPTFGPDRQPAPVDLNGFHLCFGSYRIRWNNTE